MRLVAIPVLACSLFALAGCTFTLVEGTRTASLTPALAAGAAPALDIEAHNGSITVMRADGSTIEVTADISARTQERLDDFVLIVSETEGAIQIRAIPPGGRWRSGESCAFEIRTPGTSAIRADSSNGEITLVGLAGPAKLDTSNGAIRIRAHDGPITAETSNGAITLDGVKGGAVRAETSNGAISLAMDAPIEFDLDSSNGSITVKAAPEFKGRVRLTTTNGRVAYRGFGTVRELMDTADDNDHRVDMNIGEGGPECSASTTNGNVTLEAR